jgi:outer membrane protein assembly factor BamB
VTTPTEWMDNMDFVPDRHHRGRRAPSALATCLLLIAATLALCSCGSSTPAPPLTGSGYPNGSPSNTRQESSTIDQANVSKLAVAWTLPLTARSLYGSFSSAPIIAGGVIFAQDLDSNVRAIDLQTGSVLWTKTFESPDQGPNGLVVAGGRVYGATATAAFALEEKTGRLLWLDGLVRNAHEGIDMAPGYHNGVVYVSTVPGNNTLYYGSGAVGVLWALEGATGRRLWHFDTAPESLWGKPSVNSGGGVWYTPAFDEQGSMYFGTGNPAPFPGTEQYPWGSSRPGPNLYTDSLVKLNATTGKLEWYYQLTPHDLYDRDLQDPPILLDVNGRQEVVTAGKAGFVMAFDRESGRLLWKRGVAVHNGHDNDNVYAMNHEYSRLKLPETVYPGLLGGVIAPLSTNGTTIFVPVVNHLVKYTKQTLPEENSAGGGELVALEAATGKVKWIHKFASSLFGATTVVNDLVFATALAGTVYAFSTATGELVHEFRLTAGTNTGVAISGDTLVAPAGLPVRPGQAPEMVAYRLGG